MTTTLKFKTPRGIFYLAAVVASLGLSSCGGGGNGNAPPLIPGLVSGASVHDNTPPMVSDTSPSNGATGVALNSAISATFSEAVTNSTVNAASFTLKSTAGSVPVAGVVGINGNTATYVPSASLDPSTQYTATITTAVKDVAGNSLATNFSWNFTTGVTFDTTPPTVSATSPANAATDVATNSSVSVTFSKAMTNSTLNAASFILVPTTGGGPIAGTVSVNGNTAQFTPSVQLAATTQYTASVAASVTDAAGNLLGSDFSWSFTTAAAPDTTPPTVSDTAPSNGATGVPVNSSVSATFSEAMTNSTLNATSFTLATAGGGPIAGTVNVNGNTARLTPLASLAGSTRYTATITTAARDAAGNALAVKFTWNFVTAAIPDTTPPTVSANSPANGANGVALISTISVTFSEAMKDASINTASFTLVKTTSGTPVAGTVNVSGTIATLTPSANLALNTQYTAVVSTAAQDAAGNALVTNYIWTFITTVGDITPPTVTVTTPSFGATGVALNASLSAIFSEAMTNSTINTTSFTLVETASSTSVAGAVSVSGTTATFAPSADLAPSNNYIATITTSVLDAAGNALATNIVWDFTTASATPVNIAGLAWDAVSDPNLSGYRVYYGTASGTYLQSLGQGLDVGNVPTYTVTGLNSGTRYYFAVTAFGTAGNESGFSNEVFKDIP